MPYTIVEEAIQYVRDHNLLPESYFFDDIVTVFDMSRRNDNTAIFSPKDGGIFLKRGRDRQRSHTVGLEVRNLEFLRSAFPRLSDFIPTEVSSDAADGRLVVELIRGAQTLRSLLGTRRRLPLSIMRQFGRVLGLLHACPFTTIDPERLGCMAPGVSRFLAPDIQSYSEFTGATFEFLGAVQASAVIAASLEMLRLNWRPVSLIHGDVRWENLIRDADKRAYLIDFEFLQIGDPIWDIACYLSEIIWHWLSSLPTKEDSPPDADQGTRPYKLQQPAIQAFREAYRKECPYVETNQDDDVLLVSYMALRIIGSVYERVQWQRSLDRHCVIALQLAENILRDPTIGFELLGMAT